MHVLLYHPDLGLGGAERFIIDLATSLQSLSHTVEIHTSQFSPTHSFPECAQLNIHVHANIGRWKPTALVEYVKALYCAIYILCSCLFGRRKGKKKVDVICVDQVSVGIPILKWTGAKVRKGASWIPR
jgi:alpha-1,3/alpha-1,6-mannosyltransferase